MHFWASANKNSLPLKLFLALLLVRWLSLETEWFLLLDYLLRWTSFMLPMLWCNMQLNCPFYNGHNMLLSGTIKLFFTEVLKPGQCYRVFEKLIFLKIFSSIGCLSIRKTSQISSNDSILQMDASNSLPSPAPNIDRTLLRRAAYFKSSLYFPPANRPVNPKASKKFFCRLTFAKCDSRMSLLLEKFS